MTGPSKLNSSWNDQVIIYTMNAELRIFEDIFGRAEVDSSVPPPHTLAYISSLTHPRFKGLQQSTDISSLVEKTILVKETPKGPERSIHTRRSYQNFIRNEIGPYNKIKQKLLEDAKRIVLMCLARKRLISLLASLVSSCRNMPRGKKTSPLILSSVRRVLF